MKLSEVLKGIEEIEVRGDLEIDVPSIAYDSRKVENGGMFVAIVGFKMDGHNYIESAIQSGAKDFIVKPFQADRVLESVKKVLN